MEVRVSPALRTNADVVRWIAIQTLFALSCVAPATLIASFWLCGGDFARSFSGYEVLRFALMLSVGEALIFTPVVAIRSIETLRELNVMRDELERLACTDPLTGLYNRRGFDAIAARAVDTLTERGRPAAVLMCDFDHFKQINDAYGHEFGDAVLKGAADLLRKAAGGDKVFLARIGGEEFVALLGDCGAVEAMAFAERVRTLFAAHSFDRNGESAMMTVSIGLATTGAPDDRVVALLARADAALYEAKRAGRNRISPSAASLTMAA